MGTPAELLRPDEAERIAAVRRYNILDSPPDGAFDRIAAMAARRFKVPIAIVSIVDSDRIWFKAHHGVDVTEIGRDPGLCASAILSAEPWIVNDAAHDPRCLTNPLVAGDFGLRFYAGVPLTTHDGFKLGTLCVLDHAPRLVTGDETDDLIDLAGVVVDELELRLAARRAVDAAENRLREVEHLAHAMQTSLLPPELPTIPHIRLAALFRPASRHEVGGDFYDVFPIDEQTWGVVIGDVCGKGPEAAVTTSCARYSIRAAAIQQPTASTVLQVVNRALGGDDAPGDGRFVTALFARLKPSLGGTTVTFSSGGHPLPLHVSAGGEIRVLGTPGMLLGVFQDVDVHESTVELSPGDTLVLVTDGVLDSGNPPLQQDGLIDLLGSCRDLPPGEMVQRVHEAVATAQRDDLAILAIMAAPLPAST